MRKLLFGLLCLFILTFLSSIHAGNTGMIIQEFAAGGAGCTTYLFAENFDGTGYNNTESDQNWIESGTVNEDDTTSPSPLAGTHSLELYGGGYIRSDFTFSGATTNYGIHFVYQHDGNNDGTTDIFYLYDNVTIIFKIRVNTSDQLIFVHGTANAGANCTITNINAPVYIWVYAGAETGGSANGTTTYYVSTSAGTKDLSGCTGTPDNDDTDGTGDGTADKIRLQSDSASQYAWFDNIIHDDEDIGTSPNPCGL